MKIKRTMSFATALLLLFACCLTFVGCEKEHTHRYGDEWASGDVYHWQICLGCGEQVNKGAHKLKWVVDEAATTEAAGSKHEECSVCRKVTQTLTIPQLSSSTRTVDFYAINDFHGETDKISRVGGYLKRKKDADANTVILNSGDMFQGSMESNSNYGKLLADCMEEADFDAFTFGNHEFDWGLEKLGQLAQNSSVPFLGANIYHWNANDKAWGSFASELAREYVVKTLDNGLKVGIIGVIGENQITSISSNLVQTIGFKDPLPIIKNLSVKLRNDEGCNVVAVSIHAQSSSINGKELGGLVDAVFCAHSHQYELGEYANGIPYIQGASNGRYISNIQFSVTANGNVDVIQHQNIDYSSSWPNLIAVDELVNNANAQIAEERSRVLTDLVGSLNSSTEIPRLVCRAMAKYAQTTSAGKDIVLAMTNNARSGLYGEITYSHLYEALPFDNLVYVAKVKGRDIINQASRNSIWRVNGNAIDPDKYYKIAVIDYLLFHQNPQRDYNYFPSAFTSGFTPVALTKSGYDAYNYRFVTRDFLLNNTIEVYDYTHTSSNTDERLLTKKVVLDY